MDSPLSILNNMAGYLRRPAKTGKTFGLRRKRFYKLDGGILSKHSSENSDASWIINIQGASIVKLSPTHFAIEHNNLDKDASKDFENNRVILYAKDEDECKSWVDCLRYASQRRIQNAYEIGEVIGEGGFAKVRVGRCRRTGELRAIKTMEKEEAHAKLYGREIAIIKRVNHPNIVTTFDVFENENEIHIVMEYMAGGMLYDAIEDGVKFEEADVVQCMREIIDGIIYLHNLGIVHRDLKPENILCTQDVPPFHVKISDFGLSSIANIAEMKEKRLLMSTMIGTPEFIAPEIAKRQPYTEKVDVWALGMLCYNTIAHKLPLDENKDMIVQLRQGINLDFPEKEWEAFGEMAKSFIRAVLCPDPEKRLSPFGCLVHPWLDLKNKSRGVSTKIGAHGRFSSLFLVTNLFGSDDGRDSNPLLRRKLRSIFVSGTWSAKTQWMIAFSAVRAFNRFRWLVHPRSVDILVQSVQEGSLSPERKKIQQAKGLEVDFDSMTHHISVGSDFSLTEEISSFLDAAERNRFSIGKQRMFVSGNPYEGPKSLFETMFKVRRKKSKLEAAVSTGISPELDDIAEPSSAPASLFARLSDASVTKKVKNTLTKKASGKLSAPVRKLSKRLMKRNDSRRDIGPSPLAAGGLELELNLKSLGVTEVDDGCLLGLERGETSKSPNNASVGCSPDEKAKSVTSPCTPVQDLGAASEHN
ncbi:unnamed protein product [Agarophyton chilense]|eukprot:gb/GEZJ01001644.1/.p1 GENE.gb/GEZJ01001644.1/~~gb/GEZJ01001644.1/.p1  ORF type:complete len:699 (-),score=109.88 gb/GEZJ01001644.1/:1553-3649(-)